MRQKKKSYYELLKDPRWQKRRLEIMEARNWECQNCGNNSETLNVHHGAYLKGKKPWEYPSEMLHCLCEPCHKQAQEDLDALLSSLGKMEFIYLPLIQNIIECHFDPFNREKLEKAITAFSIMVPYIHESVLFPMAEYMRWSFSKREELRKKIFEDGEEVF